MKILIIAKYFPLQNSIASLRPYSWAKWWSKQGHEVTVISTKKIPRENDLKLDCSGFNLIEIPVPVESFLDRINPIAASSAIGRDVSKNNRKNIIRFFALIYKKFITKTGCFYTCRFPDWHDLWAKRIISYLKKNGDYNWDLVVTTGWPYSSHRVGLFLKNKGKTGKWICDWRDLWTQNHLYNGLKIFHPYERYLEKKFHKKADCITTVSEGLVESLNKITNTPVHCIYNGFDKDDFDFLLKNERNRSRKFTVAYLGTIYKGYQDPEPLLKAVQNLSKRGIISSSDFRIVFAGNSDILERVKELGIENYYEYKGFVPREEALQLEYDSDAVIFLEYDNPSVKGVLTGKIFEYLYIANEIWGIGTTNKTAAGELIEKTNSGKCFGYDVSKIEEYIEKRLNDRTFVSEKNFSYIENYDRKIQAEKMLELVK